MHKDINVNVSGPMQPTSTYKTVVLKGNHSFASQVTEPNMKYVIKHDFDLGGGSITIPENCLLEFDGGSLSNGTIVGQNTVVSCITKNTLNNIGLSGTFVKQKIAYSWWFNDNYDTAELLEALALLGREVFISKNRTYNIMSKTVLISVDKLYSDGAVIEFDHLKGISLSNDYVEVYGLNLTMNFVPAQYPDYDHTQGAGIGIFHEDASRQRYKNTFYIHDCSFSGHWDSSCIVSSFTSDLIVRHCKFIDIVNEDHIIYCSTSITNMCIENCIFDMSSTVTSTSGAGGRIKARTTTGVNIIVRNCEFYNAPNQIFVFDAFTDYFNLDFENCIVTVKESISNYQFASLTNVKNAKLNILNSKFEVKSNTTGTDMITGHLFGGSGTNNTILDVNVENCNLKNMQFLFGVVSDYLNIKNTKFDLEEGYYNRDAFILSPVVSIDNCNLKLKGEETSFKFYKDFVRMTVSNSSIISESPYAVLQNAYSAGDVRLKFINSVIDCANHIFIRNNGNVYIDFDEQTEIKNLSNIINNNGRWLNATFGPSTKRPTGVKVGHQYFDTDLSKPIYASAINGTTVTWVDATGTPV